MTINTTTTILLFVCLLIITIGAYEHLLRKTRKEKEQIRIERDDLYYKKTAELEQLRAALDTATSLLERDLTTHHLNKQGLIAYLVQRVLLGQEVPETQLTIIRTTIISIHLRYRGIQELESEYRDRILVTILRILRENFPSKITTIGHFDDGNAVNSCIERIYIVCRPIDNASSRAKTAIRQFKLNPTCPPQDTISVATVISTFDTKSYAIWRVLKRFRIGPQTAEAFVSDILERLELLLGQVDDWTIQEIAVEPNQTAITTRV